MLRIGNGAKRSTPYYSLTKTEYLYVATKFNDEAREKLVLRWEELGTERLKTRFPNARIVGRYDLNPGKACPCFNARELQMRV